MNLNQLPKNSNVLISLKLQDKAILKVTSVFERCGD